MYSNESWAWQKRHGNRIDAVVMRFLCIMCGWSLKGKCGNSGVCEGCGWNEDVVTGVEKGIYLICFRTKIKDINMLQLLSQEDIKELIPILGHRVKLIAGIKQLKQIIDKAFPTEEQEIFEGILYNTPLFASGVRKYIRNTKLTAVTEIMESLSLMYSYAVRLAISREKVEKLFGPSTPEGACSSPHPTALQHLFSLTDEFPPAEIVSAEYSDRRGNGVCPESGRGTIGWRSARARRDIKVRRHSFIRSRRANADRLHKSCKRFAAALRGDGFFFPAVPLPPPSRLGIARFGKQDYPPIDLYSLERIEIGRWRY
ncbi:hypothetical protein EVAR_37189_1 [Eumeta japonica]|uniref:SAM domain-containing protein n=1 Tax=Eumeta variegata TaxID=151549 RepID=A0A4C1WIJ2_EUMVA|nr:hypothetical protein EVAR_37189_1 [Eumeta japonica]